MKIIKLICSFLLAGMMLISFAACTDESHTDPNDEEITENTEEADTQTQEQITEIKEENMDTVLYLKIDDTTLTATLEDNSSAEALKELLLKGSVTIDMEDYGDMEKVGSIGTSLPRNDKQITTEPGDLILYQGSAFVIYYAPNSWNFTRLGKINDITKQQLMDILGSGDVTITLSLE